jgi:hypothetical protein
MAISDGDGREQTRALDVLNTSIAEWEQRRDAAAIKSLDETLSPELLFRRADGTVVGKPEFMRALKEESPFSCRASRDVAVTVRGERALVTLTVLATRKNDGKEREYRNIRIYFRREGRWLLEVWFNDDVTSFEKR